MSIAADVRERVNSLPTGGFLRSEEIDGPRAAVDTAFCRMLKERPDVRRVSKGLYWKGVSSRWGSGSPSRVALAVEIAGRGAGPTGWSALAELGLTTQVPSKIEVAAPGRGRMVSGTRIQQRSNSLRVVLTSLEVAILEVTRDGWFEKAKPRLKSRVSELVADGLVNPRRVLLVAREERPRLVRERVEWLFEKEA